jgi:hypothetical protein
MRKDLPEQAPVLSFFSRPIPNSHQVIDAVNCLKSTIDVYNAYNNEKTRLNFGIFYTIIRNRWSNISSQWNSDKLFNIVGHYAAAKQGFITVNATEIDYEDIRKSSDTASDLSNSTSDSQYNIINKFYNSLNSDQTSTTSINHNIAIKENKPSFTNMNKIQTSELLLNNTLLTGSETSEQQTTSNSITSNISSTSLTVPTSQPYYSNDPTFLSHSQSSYFNPVYTQSSTQFSEMNSNSKISEIETHPIIMEDGSSHTKDLSQKKGKKRSILKNKLKQSKEKPLKRMKTRSDTKVDKDSEPPTYGIMNLALASLSSQNSNTNESDDDCDNEI